MPDRAEHDPVDVDVPAIKRPGALERAALPGLIILLLALVGALSYAQPLRADDLANLNVLSANRDLLSYVSFWYAGWTGRVTGIAFLWLGLASPVLFAVLNTAAFALLAWLSLAVASGRWPKAASHDLTVLGILLVALWYALPSISETVLWTTGATAYLWTLVLMLAAIAPYRMWVAREAAGEPKRRAGAGRRVSDAAAMLALGIAAGAAQEQAAVVLFVAAGALLAGLAFRRQVHRLPLTLWLGLAGLLAGALVQVLAPGNALRSSATPVDTLSLLERGRELARYLISAADGWLLPVYPWAALLAALAHIGRPWGRPPERGRSLWWLWLLAAAATLGVFWGQPVIANLAGPRTTVYAAVLLLVAGLSARTRRTPMPGDPDWPGIRRLAIALLLVAVVSASLAMRHALILRAELVRREGFIREELAEGTVDVIVEPLGTGPTRTLNYVDITGDPAYWANAAAAEYYGAQSIRLESPE